MNIKDNSPAGAPERTELTVASAADAFERMLSGKPARQPPKKAETIETPVEAPEEGAAPEEETPELDDVEEEEDGQRPASEGSEDEDGEPDEGEDSPESHDEDQLFTVKIDGKDEQVPLKELLNGYSRTADYTRKTAALAEERRSFQAEREAVTQERATYAQILPVLAQQLQQSMPQPPDPSLKHTDPVEYVLQMEGYREQMGVLQATQAETQRLQQLAQAEEARALQGRLKEGMQKLPELIPAWKDRKTFERDVPKLRTYLKSAGYSDEEINQAYDPRAVAAAYKAMRYDELVSRKPRPDAPPLERRNRPSAAPSVSTAPRSERQLSQAKQRLAQTGHIDDAARAFGALLGKG